MARRSRSWSRRLTGGDIAIYSFLALVFFASAYPIFYVLSLAVMPYEDYLRHAIHAWPSGFTLTYFREIFRDRLLLNGFKMSLLKTVVGTSLSVVFTAMTAYALSRRQLRLGRPLSVLFLIPMFVSGGLIPYYLAIRATGLMNTFWALVIPGLVGPFTMFVMRAYFAAFPEEIIEAATIDGAGAFGVFWRVVWPTSTPIIATMALLIGTDHWMEFFWPALLVGPELQPATVVLQSIMSTRSVIQGLGLGVRLTPESFIAAVATTLILPILAVYPFLQRFVVRGIMLGSIK